MSARIAARKLLIAFCVLIALACCHVMGATLCVNPQGTRGCFTKIQDAIAAAAPGDTLLVGKGKYCENLVISKPLTLEGEDDRETVIVPALSAANPCAGSSLCGGAASSIILVESDDVTIRNLTLDGDNPMLKSGIMRGGADVDARNGIITNHGLGALGNLEVDHVTVKNVYLRAIEASSGGTFNFHDSIVDNVWGDGNSIGIFNLGGSGSIFHNKVSRCSDAISSSRSLGVRFVDNEVTASGGGIHTETAQAADSIQVNKVSDGTPGGYGIRIFAPQAAPLVIGNEITNVDVGLAAVVRAAGSGSAAAFIDNVVTGKRVGRSIGFFLTTDQVGRNAENVSVRFAGNIITRCAEGIRLESAAPNKLGIEGSCNAILQSSGAGLTSSGSGTNQVSIEWSNFNNNSIGISNQNGQIILAGNNWWGCDHGPGAPGCDIMAGLVDPGSVQSQPSRCAPSGLRLGDPRPSR